MVYSLYYVVYTISTLLERNVFLYLNLVIFSYMENKIVMVKDNSHNPHITNTITKLIVEYFSLFNVIELSTFNQNVIFWYKLILLYATRLESIRGGQTESKYLLKLTHLPFLEQQLLSAILKPHNCTVILYSWI